VTVPPTDLVTRAEPRGGELAPLVERLAEEMGRRWRAGECPPAEEFLARHPELAAHPEAALELIAEELYLRAEAGAEPATADLLDRFPQWRRQVQALLDCHQLLSTHLAPPRVPETGEALGDFRLLAELGRGAHGRVYLARQPALADRPVVLKLAPAAGHEHLSLSRLQHTHIVPLHSVHDFPERGLRGLCQPYFGGASLAELLGRLEAVPPGERTGADLLRALEASQAEVPAAVVKGPARQFLERATYVQAVCWLGACLADALQYAHERGLLHLDVKPSNVLLAGDGTPMLLDFHLAHPPLTAGAPAPSGLGGTPGYMAPEHQKALTAVAGRMDVTATVDARADIYTLGVLLYGALGGAVPVPAERPGAALRRRNARVAVGLADLLERCLAADPRARYRSAGELASDLRRHLVDLPLRGVANRSLAERWRRWRRRQPYAPLLAGLLLAGVVAAGLYVGHVVRQTRAAEAAWEQGEKYQGEHRYVEAVEAFHSGAVLAEDLPLADGLRLRLRDGANQAERGLLAGELHQVCEAVRPLYGTDFLPVTQVRRAADRCHDLWEKRKQIAELLDGRPAPEAEQLNDDLLDLAILWANLRVRLAPPAETPAAHREALEVLAQAEAVVGPSRILYHERRLHALALGQTEVAEAAARQEKETAARGAWEHYALGRSYLQAGDLARADEELDEALDLEPQGLWTNFSKGVCAYRRKRYEDARAAFTACVALAPRSGVCFYNRGRAYAALRRFELAQQDYKHARQLDPSLVTPGLTVVPSR
jgi:serine/threonine protein kinase